MKEKLFSAIFFVIELFPAIFFVIKLFPDIPIFLLLNCFPPYFFCYLLSKEMMFGLEKIFQSESSLSADVFKCQQSKLKLFSKSSIMKTGKRTFRQGCQIFLGTTYQNGKNIPNDHKMYQMDPKCSSWP
jgi:hypothetical protein